MVGRGALRTVSAAVDAEVAGPAILEQPDTTIWIEPGFIGRVDRLGNLLIRRQP